MIFMKTEELNALTDEELVQVSGGCSTSKPNTSATPTSESGTK